MAQQFLVKSYHSRNIIAWSVQGPNISTIAKFATQNGFRFTFRYKYEKA